MARHTSHSGILITRHLHLPPGLPGLPCCPNQPPRTGLLGRPCCLLLQTPRTPCCLLQTPRRRPCPAAPGCPWAVWRATPSAARSLGARSARSTPASAPSTRGAAPSFLATPPAPGRCPWRRPTAAQLAPPPPKYQPRRRRRRRRRWRRRVRRRWHRHRFRRCYLGCLAPWLLSSRDLGAQSQDLGAKTARPSAPFRPRAVGRPGARAAGSTGSRRPGTWRRPFPCRPFCCRAV
mmetsp:Transcript_36791/g.88328  ORF Transcript_36791/g.88328 Transcript_36791/m.88328 type:complete len:234 (+) Transcript_36791:119-820(+)